MTDDEFDSVVVGAGRRGLPAARRRLAAAPPRRLAVVEAQPQPGGSVRTQRSNGYVCELGPFAFAADELAAWLAPLAAPPRPIAAAAAAAHGFCWDGAALQPIPVAEAPHSFRTGNEEVVQAYRRELGHALWLGRAVAALAPTAAGWAVDLAGEAPTRLLASEVVLALPTDAAARLLGGLDPALAALVERLHRRPGAFVWFGGHADANPALAGYGIAPAPEVASPIAELICCSAVFPRALPGYRLLRAEVADAALLAGDDAAVAAAVEAELRRWTGTTARLPFVKVHRFAVPDGGAAWVEARQRLHGLAARAPGLVVA